MPDTPRTATARVPGTCGELVQGLVEGQPFLVSCPIDRYTAATVTWQPGPERWDVPADSPKAVAALKAALALVEAPPGRVSLSVQSELARGRGLGSSTADIAAAAYAVGEAFGRPLAPETLARLALAIEPTDGSLFPGLVVFDHLAGALCQPLGPPPALDVLVLDWGTRLDTVTYNRLLDRERWAAQGARVAEALTLVRAGLARGDRARVGAGATLSARAHQAVLPKPQLERILALARAIGALGVNVAHSGTVIGVLIEAERPDAPELARYLAARLPGLESARRQRLVGGGYNSEPTSASRPSGRAGGD